jgi:hypothetical protein
MSRCASSVLIVLVCTSTVWFSVDLHGQPKAEPQPEAPKWALTGNLLQLMRGVYLPTANMIFNVQTHDPAKKSVSVPTGSIDWVQWGGSLYSGWEDVDYAAAVLSEVTPLLLVPGRVCQNGTPVPVERSDWVRYTQDMLHAARAAYEAAKTRDQEKVSEATNELSDACQACHRVYRDRRGPGGAWPEDPANATWRCAIP